MPYKWENNIMGFIPKTDWIDVPFRIERPGDPADQLFRNEKTDNITAEWESIAAEYQNPIPAEFHAFDTEARTTVRMPIDSHNIEKGLVKVKINQSERMRTLLRKGVSNGERLYEYVINDGVNLAEQVVTRTKIAVNELASTGEVSIDENNLKLKVSYGVTHNNLTLDFSNAQKDIETQIDEIVSQARDAGVMLNGIYTAGHVIGKLRRSSALQKLIYGNLADGALIKRSDLEAYLADEFGINQIITNDLTYNTVVGLKANGRPNVKAHRYFDKNKVTFFQSAPDGRIGVGLWGDAPEADLDNLLDTSGSTVSPYITITQWAEEDPATLWTKASALYMPMLYHPDSLWIATVSE